ncbi:FtsX-like permease family protein [Clostridium transplantifaecale]|uniref:FtsX-like permease family protein n=1 Tax=Clostridium transplantifaecale TaxID=2479838 RepID=UPI000F636498|nr:ABC transporter permease [Clostridium transplantifaecale]
MYGKLILNDIRKGKLIAVTIAVFIAIAAALTSSAAMLGVNLSGAVGQLMEETRAIDFMQMHSGEVDGQRLQNFADTQGNVEAYQLAKFLNMDASELFIRGRSLEGSIQDNGFSMQNEAFDFLLDLNGEIIHPADGEVYVPLCYKKNGAAKLGDILNVHGVSFTVAGFLRDSQMNADLVGSKRFLVSGNDFARLESFGSMEYLIEFRLKDRSAFSAFQSDYFAQRLPSNGPPVISRPLLMMANSMTDGLMIAVLVLISILVVVVAFLCIRFTLLAKLQEDYREIGVLKAVGMRGSQIANLYAVKYGAIAGIACVLGFLLSFPLSGPLMENIRLYMGGSSKGAIAPLIGVLGAMMIFLAVMLYVKTVLQRFGKISAAEAVRFGAPQEESNAARGFRFSQNKILSSEVFLAVKDVLCRKKLYATMFTVLVISSFLFIVPQNIYNTISARSFMTYLGVGESDISVHLTQTQADDLRQAAADMIDALAADESVARYTVLSDMVFNIPTEDGRMERLRVELGDHTAFPVMYARGGPPVTETEIALSSLNADELGKSVGEELTLVVEGKEKRMTICGIYSDITNAGKTAKAAFQAKGADFVRVVIPIELKDRMAASQTAARYQSGFPFATIAVSDEYVRQTFGGTLAAIQKAAFASIAAAVLLTILITLLFMKMIVTKDRYSIAILKSLGFSDREICWQYVARSIIVAALGVIIGVILANTLGELFGMALISTLGATTFHFVVNPFYAYLFAPLLIVVCVYSATLLGISDIRKLKISEHIKEV